MVALSAMLLAAAAAVPAPVQRALDAAIAVPRARVAVTAWEPSDACVPERAEVSAPIRGSGRVAVRVLGAGCGGWGWAAVRVFAPTVVVEAKVPRGDPLAGKVRSEEREVLPGREPVAAIPEAAVAARTLPAGSVIEARHVRVAGTAPGTSVRVIVRRGALEIEQEARVIPCPGGAVCAQLPGGARVAGRLAGDRLVVEDP